MFLMDPEVFLEVANEVTKLKMWPYFDIAHGVLCCLHIRDEDQITANSINSAGQSANFTRRHPLSTWVSSMLVIFSGGMLANFFLGEPVLEPLKNNQQLLLYTAIWYLIFYCPFDFVYKICKFLPFKLSFGCMKEIYRVKKVFDGVTHSLKVFPNGFMIAIIVGVCKGNGAGFIQLFERLLRGVWTPSSMEILKPSFPTKACLAASIIFILDKKSDLITAPHSLLYFGIIVFFVYFKVSSILLGIHDPFQPFENIFCALFMGGLADAITRAFAPPQPVQEKQQPESKPASQEKKAEGGEGDSKKQD